MNETCALLYRMLPLWMEKMILFAEWLPVQRRFFRQAKIWTRLSTVFMFQPYWRIYVFISRPDGFGLGPKKNYFKGMHLELCAIPV